MSPPIVAGRCLPPEADQQWQFHWLAHPTGKDVWRWKDRRWISVYVQADFTPEQMADQHWAYDEPIIPKLTTREERRLARLMISAGAEAA